jgi:hypothetical protein
MVARSNAWVSGSSPAGIAASNPARGMDVLFLVSVVYCQVKASGRSLVQRIPTECGVSERDLETSIMRIPRSTRVVES